MYNMIPDTLQEVQTKLSWLLANGYSATQESVITDGILAGTDLMFEDALEGPYWTVLWQEENKTLLVRGALGKNLGVISPRTTFNTFSEDFIQNPASTWLNISTQVEKLIKAN